MTQATRIPQGPGAFTAVAPIVLASASPRRRDLLASLGIAFCIDPAQGPEPDHDGSEPARDYSLRMARLKARDTAARHAGSVVVAADTIVVLDGHVLGKPADDAEALAMLTRLSGRTHEVMTGCCILGPDGRENAFCVVSEVGMRASGEAELRAYAATGEPRDKAGAYAIQGLGGFLVSSVNGSYTNVVGLPLARVLAALLDLKAVAAASVTP